MHKTVHETFNNSFLNDKKKSVFVYLCFIKYNKFLLLIIVPASIGLSFLIPSISLRNKQRKVAYILGIKHSSQQWLDIGYSHLIVYYRF